MIESAIIEVAKQIPGLLVVAWLVVRFLAVRRTSDDAFLGALERMDGAWRESTAVRDAEFASRDENCNQFQRDIAARNEAAFAKVSFALDRNTEIIGKAVHIMDRLDAA